MDNRWIAFPFCILSHSAIQMLWSFIESYMRECVSWYPFWIGRFYFVEYNGIESAMWTNWKINSAQFPSNQFCGGFCCCCFCYSITGNSMRRERQLNPSSKCKCAVWKHQTLLISKFRFCFKEREKGNTKHLQRVAVRWFRVRALFELKRTMNFSIESFQF